MLTGGANKQTGKDISLLEKMQIILQKQCDALISLGYEKSVKVQCVHIKLRSDHPAILLFECRKL